MAVMTRLAGRVFRGSSTTRCAHCRFQNAPGMTSCQVCGTVLGGAKCPKCDVVNPQGVAVCGFCGHSMPQSDVHGSVAPQADIHESVAPRPTAVREETSPAALIGFGAVLSLAAAAYPWYLFGGFEVGPEQQATITHLLEAGWRGFPGVPLTLIVIAAMASTMVSVLKELETVRAAVAVVSGLVTLLSALWLSQGLARMQAPGSGPAVPLTGAILVTIGAIVVLTAGLYLWNRQRIRTSSQSPPGSTPRTTIPLEAAPTSAPIG